MARRGLQPQPPREASSDASLWEDLEDPIDAFAGISTPPLPPTSAPTHLQITMLDTTSSPTTAPDSAVTPLSLTNDLDRELFPSGQLPASSIISAKGPQPVEPTSSLVLDPARLNDTTSQRDLKATQFLRDEWLISAGQKDPDDWVDDRIPAIRAGASNTTTVAAAKRGRSSLLDQIDAICSPSSSGSSVQAASQSTHAREPLRASSSANANRNSRATAAEIDEMAATELLDMSCSPPSQPTPRIKSITDLPPEEQQFYRRLAFGGSSSSTCSLPNNVGVTARGKNGKTWQTTWNEADQPSTSSDRLAMARGSSNAARGATTTSGSASIRGRKPSGFAVGARKARGGKARSSSAASSSTSRGRSRFFASRGARGGRRGRGR